MRRTAASVGRMLVTVGLLILLFVAYQLWGTGIFTARAQDKLKREFATELRDNPTVASTTSTAPPRSTTSGAAPTTTTTTTAPAPKTEPVINEGDPVGRIQIPKIGVDFIIVQGTARDDLAKGPGHYPASPMPGQIGNTAIAGHRTTHSKPFYNLNELTAGDDVIISTSYGHYTYRVTTQQVVPPTDVSVVGPTSDAELTLTTCNPRYSARQRLVVHAKLVVKRSSSPARATVPVVVPQPTAKKGTTAKSSLQAGLSGDPSSRVPATIWGIVLLIVGLIWWWVYRRWRHPLTWLVGVVPFLPLLFVFYVYVERLLPANY